MTSVLFRVSIVLFAAGALWLSGDALAAGRAPTPVAMVSDASPAETRVAEVQIQGNLRASAFLMSDEYLRVGGLRRLHVLNPRVPSLRVEVQDASGRVLSSAVTPTFMRNGEQWVELPLQPGLGALTVTLSR